MSRVIYEHNVIILYNQYGRIHTFDMLLQDEREYCCLLQNSLGKDIIGKVYGKDISAIIRSRCLSVSPQ